MNITKVQVYQIDSVDSKLKGFVQLTIDDCFKLTGIKIFEGVNGLYISYVKNPASKADLCFAFPTKEETRKEIEYLVLTEYERISNES
tara:strand:+ start:113 stop:376 length:264 start_codon:yes stop_codon:yes gene_type:complete